MQDAAICAAVFLGGIVSGFAGFAFSAVAGAILLHFLAPILAVPLMMACTIVSQLTTLAVLRRFVDWRATLPMILGGLAGLPIGLSLLVLAPPQTYRVAFGLFLVGYAGYMLLRRPAARFVSGAAAAHFVVGCAGGLVGGFTGMPGAVPVMWCELRGVSGERQRGVVQPFILGMQVLAVALLALTPGVASPDLWRYTLFAMPALAGGVLVGFLLYARIDQARFRIVVLWLLAVSGLLIVF
jgi:uncharacterized protein